MSDTAGNFGIVKMAMMALLKSLVLEMCAWR
jgi:hypothetical protein